MIQIFKKPEKFKKLVMIVFLIVPLLSSLISSIHLVDLFNLGNHIWMSYVLAFAFEMGSIAAFLVLSILDKINKTLVWIVFIMLTVMQILGNIYFSYDFVFTALLNDPNWLLSFQEMVGYFVGNDLPTIKMMLSVIIGLPIPLVSLFLLKSLAEYLTYDDTQPERDDIGVDQIDDGDFLEIDENFSIPNDEILTDIKNVDTSELSSQSIDGDGDVYEYTDPGLTEIKPFNHKSELTDDISDVIELKHELNNDNRQKYFNQVTDDTLGIKPNKSDVIAIIQNNNNNI